MPPTLPFGRLRYTVSHLFKPNWPQADRLQCYFRWFSVKHAKLTINSKSRLYKLKFVDIIDNVRGRSRYDFWTDQGEFICIDDDSCIQGDSGVLQMNSAQSIIKKKTILSLQKVIIWFNVIMCEKSHYAAGVRRLNCKFAESHAYSGQQFLNNERHHTSCVMALKKQKSFFKSFWKFEKYPRVFKKYIIFDVIANYGQSLIFLFLQISSWIG